MGISPVAVYSDVDRCARHVRDADEAYLLGPAPPRSSYLNQEKILEIAAESGAGAVHPGYGFLSENPDFAAACAARSVVFVGPPAAAIHVMGNKVEARRLMLEAGVSVTPGSAGEVSTVEEIRRVARQVGYPILLKAAAGGGGRGMRVVQTAAEIEAALAAVQSEAGSAFGDRSVFVERLVERPRHIEVQILSGPDGRTVHLGERECSIQRRHQKLVEESPSPAVDEALRNRLGSLAVRAAEAVDYRNAGTVGFIMDGGGEVYFMEMNTRLQVEHPVTEMVTGVDLVKAQIRIAAGIDPGLRQEDIQMRGAAIECRIFAEDPARGFLPSPGRLKTYRPPAGPGVREDAGVHTGDAVPTEYDPMIAKLIAWGGDRHEAVERMARALDEYRISGVPTTLPFHQALMAHPAFRAGNLDTGFIQRHGLKPLSGRSGDLEKVALVAALLAAREDRMRRAVAARPGPPSMSSWKRAALREGQSRLPGGGGGL
ncbi:MAG: acetyl/propionyl/methylcrotonyl-CoA carboxylase subunit alpha, partial [Acidobacteriota bacterium]